MSPESIQIWSVSIQPGIMQWIVYEEIWENAMKNQRTPNRIINFRRIIQPPVLPSITASIF